MQTYYSIITKGIIAVLLYTGLINKSFGQEKIVLQGQIEVIKMYEEEEIFAVLKVVSNQVDENGTLISSLEEFPIEDNVIGRRLYQLDGKTVEATGTIFEDNYGPVWFSVTSFKLIEAADDTNQTGFKELEKPDN
jgi:hypothetical protein